MDRMFDTRRIALDTGAGRSYDSAMPLWRCPHCSTPQAEAARCWVCHRSTTSCATCRHFRRSVASGLGLCGLDSRRLALTGTEMRECWAAPDVAAQAVPGGDAVAAGTAAVGEPGGRRPRTFVPVEEITPPRPTRTPAAAPTPTPVSPLPRAWSLWGDAEPHAESRA